MKEYYQPRNHNEAELYNADDPVLYVWRDMKVLCKVVSNDSTSTENIFTLEVIRTIVSLGAIDSEGGNQPPITPGRELIVKKPRGERDIPDTWYLYTPGTC